MLRGRGKALAAAALWARLPVRAPLHSHLPSARTGKGHAAQHRRPSDWRLLHGFHSRLRPGEPVSCPTWNINEEWLAAAYRRRECRLRRARHDPGRAASGDRRCQAIPALNSSAPESSAMAGMKSSCGQRGWYWASSPHFSYTHTGDPHDEVDFEILGRSTASVHTSTSTLPARTAIRWTSISPSMRSEREHLYAFEWLPEPHRLVCGWRAGSRPVTSLAPGAYASRPRRAASWRACGSPRGRSAEWVGEPDFRHEVSATYRCMSHVPARTEPAGSAATRSRCSCPLDQCPSQHFACWRPFAKVDERVARRRNVGRQQAEGIRRSVRPFKRIGPPTRTDRHCARARRRSGEATRARAALKVSRAPRRMKTGLRRKPGACVGSYSGDARLSRQRVCRR